MYPPSNYNQGTSKGMYRNRYPTIGGYNDDKYKGICKRWNDIKGYGFIKMNNGSNDVFVDKSKIKSGHRLFHDANVKLNVVTQDDGERKAINVDIIRFNDEYGYGQNKYNSRFRF